MYFFFFIFLNTILITMPICSRGLFVSGAAANEDIVPQWFGLSLIYLNQNIHAVWWTMSFQDRELKGADWGPTFVFWAIEIRTKAMMPPSPVE